MLLYLVFTDSKINNVYLLLKEPTYENFENYKSKNQLVKYLKNDHMFLNSFSCSLVEINEDVQIGKLQSMESLMKYEMYSENSFKNKKMLIVMLYSA